MVTVGFLFKKSACRAGVLNLPFIAGYGHYTWFKTGHTKSKFVSQNPNIFFFISGVEQ